MEQKKRWSDFSPAQRAAIIAGATAELIVTAIAVADLARRPASDVRGPKPLWLLGLVVQPVGPVAYFVLGRRQIEPAD